VGRDMPFERESARELTRAVAAREAAPTTAELLGQGLLSYCNMFRRRRRLLVLSDRRHGTMECSCKFQGSLLFDYFLLYI